MSSVFSIRSLFGAVTLFALLASLIAWFQPPNYRKLAGELGGQISPVPPAALLGEYHCGARGQVYQLCLNSDGTFDLREDCCLGIVGTSTGYWTVVDNVIEFDVRSESGELYSFSWALVSQAAGHNYLTPDSHFELYVENGYSPLWSLSKSSEIKALRAATGRPL